MQALLVSRAYHCGARYAANRWRRRPPPRMRTTTLVGRADHTLRFVQQVAFYQGYDALQRARIVHDRAWSEPWLQEASHAA